jgi:hypothetical protein
MARTPTLLTQRVEVTPFEDLTEDRYEFLGLSQAEPNLGTSVANNVLTMGASNTRVWSNSITLTSITATGNLSGGNISTAGDISATGNITAGNISITGNLGLGNLTVNNTTISTNLANGNITLAPTGTELAIIDTSTGLVVPVGNTAQRPNPGTTGTLRFNTELLRLEVYDGFGWEDMAANVTNQTINGDGSTTIFVLDRSSTTPSALIMLNGVVQIPVAAYNIAGNVLTFAQAPESTDVIDVRFL